MKKIIITGATGFAGSHILEAFQSNPISEYEVVAACRNQSKLSSSFLGDTLIGDLADREYINRLTAQADVICHAAAWTELNGKDKDSKKYFYDPTIELINSATKNGVKRFIFLSFITSNPIKENHIRPVQWLA